LLHVPITKTQRQEPRAEEKGRENAITDVILKRW